MTIAQMILERIQEMPEDLQAEVLDFVTQLETQGKPDTGGDEDFDWSAFSLSTAMRGMEGEETPYSMSDLRESFS